MTTKWMRLVIAGAAALVAAAGFARGGDLQPAVVSSLTGDLQIDQPLPLNCDDVKRTVALTSGRIEFTPVDGVDIGGGARSFVLSRASVSFEPFHIHASCDGDSGDEDFSTVSVQLAHAASFTGAPLGGGVYAVTIPRTGFQLYEAATVNGTLSTNYLTPLQDVTGTIDLTQGTLQLTVVIATSMHFSIGCTPIGCLYDNTLGGTLTTTISGPITFPDSDGDGVPNRTDNCPLFPNADQSPVPTPVISAPPGVTLASCKAHTIGAPRATDVCDGGPLTVTSNAPAVFSIGPNPVTWTATDAKSRTATAMQTVTVVDTTPPVFTSIPPDVQLNNCVAAALGAPTATDDCAGVPAFSNNAPAIFGLGTTHVTWTATDASANHTSDSSQSVTVVDTTPPTVSCVAGQPPGNAFKATTIDACGSSTITLGSYVIANGETIKIDETGQGGVTLVNTADGVRHFHVGKGQAVVTATDGSGNVSTAVCR
ncbi:MAG TPA: thrombospondin type 3 repeat-containing protein [Vicinamibacterales bacterium]|jgi:hypothetical protein|nr:thrombospondin type 3 repeat-containing protein [Vicinamibacterales bacterium]